MSGGKQAVNVGLNTSREALAGDARWQECSAASQSDSSLWDLGFRILRIARRRFECQSGRRRQNWRGASESGKRVQEREDSASSRLSVCVCQLVWQQLASAAAAPLAIDRSTRRATAWITRRALLATCSLCILSPPLLSSSSLTPASFSSHSPSLPRFFLLIPRLLLFPLSLHLLLLLLVSAFLSRASDLLQKLDRRRRVTDGGVEPGSPCRFLPSFVQG